jgi:hypothetical protein
VLIYPLEDGKRAADPERLAALKRALRTDLGKEPPAGGHDLKTDAGPLMKSGEVAQLLQVSKKTVYRPPVRASLTFPRVSPGQRWPGETPPP